MAKSKAEKEEQIQSAMRVLPIGCVLFGLVSHNIFLLGKGFFQSIDEG